MPNPTPPQNAQCCLTNGEKKNIDDALRDIQVALGAQAGMFNPVGLSGQVTEQLRSQGAFTRGQMAKWSRASETVWFVIGGSAVGIILLIANHFWPLPGGAH